MPHARKRVPIIVGITLTASGWPVAMLTTPSNRKPEPIREVNSPAQKSVELFFW